MTLIVSVSNKSGGHKFPTGSTDLRVAWLEVSACIGDTVLPLLPSENSATASYEVAGAGEEDRELLGDDIPRGSRVYRAIFVDNTRHQTFSSYNATKIIFDNRLNPEEIRKETYRLQIPSDAKGAVSVVATLRYLFYTSYLAKRLNLTKPQPIEISSEKRTITVSQ